MAPGREEGQAPLRRGSAQSQSWLCPGIIRGAWTSPDAWEPPRGSDLIGLGAVWGVGFSEPPHHHHQVTSMCNHSWEPPNYRETHQGSNPGSATHRQVTSLLRALDSLSKGGDFKVTLSRGRTECHKRGHPRVWLQRGSGLCCSWTLLQEDAELKAQLHQVKEMHKTYEPLFISETSFWLRFQGKYSTPCPTRRGGHFPEEGCQIKHRMQSYF